MFEFIRILECETFSITKKFLKHLMIMYSKFQNSIIFRETGDTPCDVKCWYWHKSPFAKYNRHVKNWKRHPNFRYRNCQKRLPGLCKRTKFINPCEDGSHKCPTNSECIAGEGKEFSCKCPEGSWLNKDLSSLLNFDILFFEIAKK